MLVESSTSTVQRTSVPVTLYLSWLVSWTITLLFLFFVVFYSILFCRLLLFFIYRRPFLLFLLTWCFTRYCLSSIFVECDFVQLLIVKLLLKWLTKNNSLYKNNKKRKSYFNCWQIGFKFISYYLILAKIFFQLRSLD